RRCDRTARVPGEDRCGFGRARCRQGCSSRRGQAATWLVTPVTWSPEAIRDVESIRAFIAQDSPVYAELVARRIVAAVERLHFFPESGRMVPERQDPEIREVVVA